MRKLLCCKLRTSGTPCFLAKMIFTSMLIFVVFQVIRYGYMSSNIHAKAARSLADLPSYSSWHCELNKRMLRELQREIRDKDKLLNYRGKVIMKLRAQLQEANETNAVLRGTLYNLTEVVVPKITNITNQQSDHLIGRVGFSNAESDHPEFLENMKDKVDRVARPCCIALKRMTDILRVYMETTQDLRDQVAAYRQLNITEKMYEYAEQEKRKFAALNCSEQFRKETENLTKKQEKHSLYQTYSNGYFYETFPLNRVLPKQKFKSKSYHRNIDFAKAVNIGLQELLKDSKLSRTYFEMNEGLVHYGELRGAEYKFTFLYNKTRTFSVNVMKPYGPHILSDSISEQTLKNLELINIIIPISGRTDRLNNFLKNIRTAIQIHRENIYLTVIIYGTDSSNEIKNTIKDFSKRNNFKNYDILKKDLPFNRGRALHDGINRWNGYQNVLMFLCDVDIKFNHAFLNRCRQNTKLGQSVYMPIVYSLYNPSIVNKSYTDAERFNISENTGTWRPLGYGMLCVYKPDYMKVRGFNLKINGWGGEDVSLYQRFLKRGVKVIRAPDPDLFHIWHPKLCSSSLSKRQYKTCVGSKARYEASQRQLGILLFSKNESLSNS